MQLKEGREWVMISIHYWRAGTAPGARCNNFSAQEVLHTRRSGGGSQRTATGQKEAQKTNQVLQCHSTEREGRKEGGKGKKATAKYHCWALIHVAASFPSTQGCKYRTSPTVPYTAYSSGDTEPQERRKKRGPAAWYR